jgi:hypothetical protein
MSKMKFSRRDWAKMSCLAAAGGAAQIIGAPAFASEDGDRFFKIPAAGQGGKPELQSAPETIVESGLIRAGYFQAPPRKMNLADSDLLRGNPASLYLRWIGAGMAHPDWYFGFIIVNAGIASLSTLYGFNRRSKEYFSHDSFGPAKFTAVADSVWDGVTFMRKPGFEMEVRHRLDLGRHAVRIDIKKSSKAPAVSADLVWHEDLSKIQPLVVMAPLAGRHFMFNHKAQMPVQGKMKIGAENLEFNPGRDLANMDEVRNCAGAKNKYQWFNFGGFDPKGKIVGLNVSKSQQRSDERWSENCIWAGKTLSFTSPVTFQVDRKNFNSPWRAFDQKGRVDIIFHPEGGKALNFGPLGKYLQKCGTFRGTLIDDSGEKHEVRDYYGCAEDMDIF